MYVYTFEMLRIFAQIKVFFGISNYLNVRIALVRNGFFLKLFYHYIFISTFQSPKICDVLCKFYFFCNMFNKFVLFIGKNNKKGSGSCLLLKELGSYNHLYFINRFFF